MSCKKQKNYGIVVRTVYLQYIGIYCWYSAENVRLDESCEFFETAIRLELRVKGELSVLFLSVQRLGVF